MLGRSYAPAGKTPEAFALGGSRHKLAMIASVTNQGKARWMINDEAFNSDTTPIPLTPPATRLSVVA